MTIVTSVDPLVGGASDASRAAVSCGYFLFEMSVFVEIDIFKLVLLNWITARGITCPGGEMAGFYRGQIPFYPNQGKRFSSRDVRDEPPRKIPAFQFNARPGFAPVPFVSEERAHEKENGLSGGSVASFRQGEYNRPSFSEIGSGPAFGREPSYSSRSFHGKV
uniref:Uncharacterized protein n=1 Tax=Knipowitschia caucasica TaxID=637954 RepID=A0AAV2MKF6_KNICA